MIQARQPLKRQSLLSTNKDDSIDDVVPAQEESNQTTSPKLPELILNNKICNLPALKHTKRSNVTTNFKKEKNKTESEQDWVFLGRRNSPQL